IANSLRLLKLPEEIRDLISDGSLSAGHGRTLVSVPDEARQIEIEFFSRDELERLIEMLESLGDVQ
ncbi:MAG: chromosome partitioning protein ParB, partial [Firmicutes bacterium]|nr:chromosome partitioning protein ParB [Bacillota bacterium]